jgi:hypothetical protein
MRRGLIWTLALLAAIAAYLSFAPDTSRGGVIADLRVFCA